MASWLVTRLIYNCSNRVIIWLCIYLSENKVDIAYLDFAKAFDSVVRNKLMFKLKAYGFDGLLYSWIRKFLSYRYQCFKVENCLSSVCNVISGFQKGVLYRHYYL